MMYLRLYPIFKIQNGQDELKNKMYEDKVSENYYPCRITNWTRDDIEIFGRDVTKNSRKMFCTGFDIRFAKSLEKVKIEDEVYKVIEVKDIGRWIFFIIERVGK